MTLAAPRWQLFSSDLAAIRASGGKTAATSGTTISAASSSPLALRSTTGSTITPACAPAPASPTARPRPGSRSFETVGEGGRCSPSATGPPAAAAGARALRRTGLRRTDRDLLARPRCTGLSRGLRQLHRRSGMPLREQQLRVAARRDTSARRRATLVQRNAQQIPMSSISETMARSPPPGRSSERTGANPAGAAWC